MSAMGRSGTRQRLAGCSPSGQPFRNPRTGNKDLSLRGLPQRKVVAAIVRLLDETCIRIGNEEYAKANKSFGLTTLRDRHADIRGQSLRFHFRGKSNQEYDITLRDRRLARASPASKLRPLENAVLRLVKSYRAVKRAKAS
jgi:DNA topoisomerase IB